MGSVSQFKERGFIVQDKWKHRIVSRLTDTMYHIRTLFVVSIHLRVLLCIFPIIVIPIFLSHLSSL